MEPVKGRLAALIAAETEEVTPPADAKARHWAAVSAAFGPMGAPPASGGPSDGGAATVAAAKGGALLKIVGGTIVAGAIATGVWASRDRGADEPAASSVATRRSATAEEAGDVAAEPFATVEPEPEPAAVDDARSSDAVVEAAPQSEAAEEPPPGEPAARPRPSTPRASARGGATAEEPEPEDTKAAAGLAEELALVESLRRAVARGDLAKAKALAARHRREFPDGSMKPDRLDLEASAHCASGDLARGRALAAELSRKWPEAPRSERLKTACGEGEP